MAEADRQSAALTRLRSWLSLPQNRGRVIRVSEVVEALAKSRAWFYKYLGQASFAQEWLQINQDAPIDAKIHYQSMINRELGDIEAPATVQVDEADGRKEFFVSKEEAKKKTTNLTSRIEAAAPARVIEQRTQVVVVAATAEEKIIERVRDRYTLAALGDIPAISAIMKDLGLTKSDGTASGTVTEEMVRKVMIAEDWRGQRRDYLHRTMDVIPDEVKLVSLVRNVEVHRMLHTEIKLLHRAHVQFYQEGRATTVGRGPNGQPTVLDNFRPDHGTVAGLAEVMRRMVDGGGNVNILINNGQLGAAAVGGGAVTGQANALSLMSRKYLGKLNDMKPEELADEIERLDALTRLLTADTIQVPTEDLDDQPILDAIYTAQPN